MNVKRDDMEDYIQDLENKLETLKKIKILRDKLIDGIRTILNENLSIDGNVHEENNSNFFTFNVKTNEYKIEITITNKEK